MVTFHTVLDKLDSTGLGCEFKVVQHIPAPHIPAFSDLASRRTSQDGTNFKAAELYRMTLFNSGFFVKIDSLTPTRGAGVRGVGGGGPGWGLWLLLGTVTHRPTHTRDDNLWVTVKSWYMTWTDAAGAAWCGLTTSH